MNMTAIQLLERRRARQMMVFDAAVMIRQSLGGSAGALEERMEHIRIAALGAVADSRAVFIALRAKGIINEKEEQFFLDQGYKAVLDQIAAGVKAMQTTGVQQSG